MLCLRKAFSPSTKLAELNITRNTLNKYMHYLRRKYHAHNTRHLMYLRYARNSMKYEGLKATRRGLQVLSGFVRGERIRKQPCDWEFQIDALKNIWTN